MRLLAALALACFIATPAMAEFQNPGANSQGGFNGPGSMQQGSMVTVQQAAGMRDDAKVILTGKITQQLAGSHDKYMFRDATGEIRVDIDRKVFRGQTVTPENTVRIMGKVDKDFGEATEIDVKRLEVLN